MARRGSAIAGNRAVGTAPSTGGALAPATPASPLAQSLATGMGVNTTGRVNQTGGWGDAYGGIALPRNPQDFTDGAFGPFSPIVPSPVDSPADDGPFPLARREEYRVGWNLPTGQPGAEGLKLADFGTLRTLADLYSVGRACITYLKSEVASLEWDVAPTTEAAKSMRNDKAAMQDFGERRGEAVKFFRRPDPDYFSWQSWMSAVMEEILVFDALSIVLRPKWGRGMKKGLLWSDLDSLNLISGPTVRPLYDMNGGTPRPPAPAYQQYLYGVPRVDMMTMIRQRDLDEGRLREAALGAYTNSQLLYLPMQPRRWTPYGFPPIERALIPVLTGLSRQGYQLDYFKEGTVPSVYISPGGDLSPNQIRELQDALNAIAGDPAWHHKIIVLPSGSHTEPQRPTPLADMFDDIIMTQVCSAFGVQPSQIGLTPRASASAYTSPGAANQAAKQNSNTQDMSSLQPTLLFLTAIMNSLLQDVCGQEDMRFIFAGMQEEEDEETTTNLLVNQVSHALITIDEARDKLGLQPYGITESTEPGFLTPTGFMFLSQPAAPELPPTGGGNDGESGGTGTGPGGKPAPGAGGNQAPAPQYGPKPNGPANSTQGRPAQPPAKEPGETSPANAAAEGTNNAKNKPDQGGVNKAATPDDEADDQPEPTDPTQPSDTLDQAAQLALEAYIAKQVAGIVTSAWQGSVSLLEAVDWIVQELAAVYLKVMKGATVATAKAIQGVMALPANDLFAFAQQRAEQQRPYSMGMVQAAVNDAAMGGTEPPAWIQGRSKLYAETLAGARNFMCGMTVKKSDPQRKIIWRLGETEHCPLCLERDGQEYTFDTLPGYPGDGGFGGPICMGGPNCGCHLDYMEGDRVLDSLGNTQRPESVGYYAQQKKDIEARRQRMATEREQFVSSLPNQVGDDDTSAQTRAMSRDQMRTQLANLANQRIRSNGGYPGVSMEPSDIPASLIASLIPQYGPIPATIPMTDIMDAVESMFAGKFAGADTTKTAFGSLMLSVVGDTVSGWERAVASEMEACARHLDKGRAASTWEPRHIDQRDVATLADLLQTGAISRAQAVKQALDNRRRWVDVGGQIMEPPTVDSGDPAADEEPPYQGAGGPVANAARTNPAGGGGYTLLPHDAEGIYHDQYDLNPANKVGPKGYVHGWIKVGEASPDKMHTEFKSNPDKFTIVHEGSDKPLASGKHDWGLGKHKEAGYSITHADGHDVGKFSTMYEAQRALADYHNSKYAAFDRKAEPRLAGYHDVMTGREKTPRELEGMTGADRGEYLRGRAEAYGEDTHWRIESLPVGKAASDPGDPNPVEAEHVYNQMLANYPPKAIQWIKKARWIGPMAVDPDRVDTQDEESWAASHEPDRVKHFAKKYKNGDDVKPGVCVQEPGQDTVKVIDGHHRFLGARKADEPYKAYVGFVGSDGGPWDETHSFQFHQGADPQNKSAVPGLTKRSGMISIDLPDGLIKPVSGGVNNHHITLAYLGPDVDDDLLNEVIARVKQVAAGTVPFTVEVGGLGRFEPSAGSDGQPVHYARVATDELTESEPLHTLRVPFAQYHASEHQDWHPHVTLAYGGDAPEPLPWTPLQVDAVSVHRGDAVTRIPLGPAVTEKSAETAELSTVHSPLGTHGLWHDKDAQLPAYIQNVAHAMIRDGHDESEAIQLAIGAVKRWAAGEGKVTPEVQVAAAGALADWERLKAEHSKTKALDPTGQTANKVGPHGFIHGWIFVGVPGTGDEVNHPEHGKGVVTGHGESHVKVQFANGKEHMFEVHRSDKESGHFAKRGDLEHTGPHTPKESPADKVLRDPKEIGNLSNDDLKNARDGLLERHEKVGAWGDESDRMDDIRAKVQREIYDRQDARIYAARYADAELGPAAVEAADSDDLRTVIRDRERQAREQGVEPDQMRGHRAARVELARRVMKNPAKWNAHDHLAIFGGTPEQQHKVETVMSRLTADVPPEKGSTLKHIAITDTGMRGDSRFRVEDCEGLYYPGDHHMEINPRVFDKGSNSLKEESKDWYSQSGHPMTLDRTLDHEFGHHLDYDLSAVERDRMFSHISEVVGTTELKPSAGPPGFLHVNRADDFVKSNKAAIVNTVGTYAATNSRELVAELWAQYHGQKLNGKIDKTEQYAAAAGDMVGHAIAGHSTPTTRQMGVE